MLNKFLVATALVVGLSPAGANAQGYTHERVGNPESIDVQPQFGLCLMGGRGESDEAMTWWLERANGGDVLVIRTTGAFAYNDYLFDELGVTVNSVETIIFSNAQAAYDPYVVQRLNEAEAIWMAGGNQSTYVNFWKDTPVMDAINNLMNVKQGPVGGLSAGMAVMGQAYYPALAGSATSESALSNPLSNQMLLGYNDFLQAPFLENVVTETHLNDPERLRYGRVTGFMARLWFDQGVRPLAIAANEFCAVTIDEFGMARAWGALLEQPEWDDDYVYFLQANCTSPDFPEIMESGQPLTWNRNQQAVKVYRVEARLDGSGTFDLNDWNSGSGGVWEDWYVDSGELDRVADATAPACFLRASTHRQPEAVIFPNPATEYLVVQSEMEQYTYTIFDISGKLIRQGQSQGNEFQLHLGGIEAGMYKLSLEGEKGRTVRTFVKYR